MRMFQFSRSAPIILSLIISLIPSVLDLRGDSTTERENIAFFEERIRPVLAGICYECHTDKEKGGLRLDSRAAILRGGDTGRAVRTGNPEASLLIEALHYGADSYQMPPKQKLPESTIRDFEHWVRMGLPWPDSEDIPSPPVKKGGTSGDLFSDEAKKFWAFQPVASSPFPEVKNRDWAQNGIDLYILDKLESRQYAPAKKADRRNWIRRASYGLRGLPPTPEEVEHFLKDESEGAYRAVIDKYLDSPRYGEHWARHWLDGVRYVSDVGYYNFSDLGWRYRDWVIRSFNRDMPYDEFITHQIAGDLLPAPNGSDRYADGIIATGVLAMGNYDDQESDKEKLYAELIDDQIDLIGRQFLGLTLACARCHDHKFDPISTADYYALGGIFMSSQVLEDKNRIGAHRLKIPLESEDDTKHRKQLEARVAELEARLANDSELSNEDRLQLMGEAGALKNHIPNQTGVTIGIREGGHQNSRHKEISDMPIYIRGNPYKLGKRVERHIPTIFRKPDQPSISKATNQSGRKELADWVSSRKNPLTARVMVNRIWQHHFGQGLVSTPSNFGKLGERPSHPELLDFLALKFMESGWSIKAMHRLIMESATYQQSTEALPQLMENDPDNVWLGRFSSRRLKAEELIDSLLAVSQELKPGIGHGQSNRSIYQRIGHEFTSHTGILFDAPPTGTIVPKRSASTTAPQALFMMNDPSAINAAKNFYQVLKKQLLKPEEMVTRSYLKMFSRLPSDRELALGTDFLKQSTEDQKWTYFHVLLCSNEFIYVD